MVDLQATRWVSAVRVYNRKDCGSECSERLDGFQIRVGDAPWFDIAFLAVC